MLRVREMASSGFGVGDAQVRLELVLAMELLGLGGLEPSMGVFVDQMTVFLLFSESERGAKSMLEPKRNPVADTERERDPELDWERDRDGDWERDRRRY